MPSVHFDACLVGERPVESWYRRLLADGAVRPDGSQENAVAHLQDFADSLTVAEDRGWRGTWRRMFAAKTGGRGGIYLHGGVGRGKTLLMDGFYLQCRMPEKMRVHFHSFMRHLHADMKRYEEERDPFARVAERLARRFRLICFDEFHVSDITDAMLLGRLLQSLFDAGVRFVMTSNYAPAGLYPNGLARDRFLPTIALLEERLQVLSLDGGEDYRQSLLATSGAYFSPWDDFHRKMVRELFDRLACGIVLQKNIKLAGRTLPVVARASDCIWFDFSTLCESARSKAEYLHLAERFSTVFLTAVPRLDDPAFGDAARRFTWLVDILYDEEVRLVLGAAVPLSELYGAKEGGESGRTMSRLLEMRAAFAHEACDA